MFSGARTRHLSDTGGVDRLPVVTRQRLGELWRRGGPCAFGPTGRLCAESIVESYPPDGTFRCSVGKKNQQESTRVFPGGTSALRTRLFARTSRLLGCGVLACCLVCARLLSRMSVLVVWRRCVQLRVRACARAYAGFIQIKKRGKRKTGDGIRHMKYTTYLLHFVLQRLHSSSLMSAPGQHGTPWSGQV